MVGCRILPFQSVHIATRSCCRGRGRGRGWRSIILMVQDVAIPVGGECVVRDVEAAKQNHDHKCLDSPKWTPKKRRRSTDVSSRMWIEYNGGRKMSRS